MVKKLKLKIFLLVMVSLSVVTLGIIFSFTFNNYRNIINTSSGFIDRFYSIDIKNRKIDDTKNDIEQKEFKLDIEGFYSIIIKDNQIIDNTKDSVDDEIKQKLIKIAEGNAKSGIIGNYIYNIRNGKDGETIIAFVENEEAVTYVKMLILAAIGNSILLLVLIYIVARKLSDTLVEPVEQAFLKQTQFISDASHELKTPLAVIEANADVLEGEIRR